MDSAEKQKLQELANRIRIKVIKMIGNAGSGHAGGSMSAADMLAVLYGHTMNFDAKNPDWPDRDRLVLSKGHAAFGLYSTLSEVGILPEEKLFTAYSTSSPCQAHPEKGQCPGIEMSTGALGQGLSAGIGMAIGAKIRKKGFRVYVIIGDGESNEGQVWEALMSAPKFGLDNLVAILDYNKLALSDPTDEVMSLEPITDKLTSFGWNVLECDGHDVEQLVEAFDEAKKLNNGKPTYIIAHTTKGKGLTHLEGQQACHAITMTLEDAEEVLKNLNCPADELEEYLSFVKEKK
jgi:transketolase